MKTKILHVLFLAIFVVFGTLQVDAQTLYGKQVKGTVGNNASLQCSGITLNKTVKITAVTGNNAGFWIQDGSVLIKNFWKKNDPSAVGFVLKPGTYYVYPNLAPNQTTAEVTLTFK